MDFPESCPKSRPCSGLREVAPLLCGPPRLQPEHVTALALSHQGRLKEDALGGWLDRDKDAPSARGDQRFPQQATQKTRATSEHLWRQDLGCSPMGPPAPGPSFPPSQPRVVFPGMGRCCHPPPALFILQDSSLLTFPCYSGIHLGLLLISTQPGQDRDRWAPTQPPDSRSCLGQST